MINLLIGEFSVLSVAPWHNTLMSFRWKRIYTTNFDSVIETARENNREKLSSVVLSNKISDVDIRRVCVHLNGHIENLDRATICNEFKLTNTSYSCDDLDGNEWFDLFKRDLQSAKAIIIVGYSMQYDIDIKRLLSAPAIAKKDRHNVIIVDGIKDKLGVLNMFKYCIDNRTTFVLTERRSVNPSYRILANRLGISENDIRPLYLDVLMENEVKEIGDILFDVKMYSSISGNSSMEMQEFIREKCRSRFSDMLLYMYNSSDIRSRIAEVWGRSSGESISVRRLAILALMKSVMGIDFNFSEMIDLLKIDYISLSTRESEFLNEFFDVCDDDIVIKSSIIARELLRSVVGIDGLIDAMRSVVEESDKEYRVNGAYYELLKNVISHSHFRIFTTSPENQTAIACFYEGIKNLSFCKDNTFYWEQFATASIGMRDFNVANQCIENAFTIAKGKPGFVPFHIENIKANYLVEKLLCDVA